MPNLFCASEVNQICLGRWSEQRGNSSIRFQRTDASISHICASAVSNKGSTFSGTAERNGTSGQPNIAWDTSTRKLTITTTQAYAAAEAVTLTLNTVKTPPQQTAADEAKIFSYTSADALIDSSNLTMAPVLAGALSGLLTFSPELDSPPGAESDAGAPT